MADGDLTGIRGGACAAGTTTTADGSTVTVCQYSPPDNSLVFFEVVVWATEYATPANTYRKVIHCIGTKLSGSTTMRDGTPDVVSEDDAGTVGFAATVDADGAPGNFRVRATGVAATNIRWAAAMYPCQMEQS